MNRDVLMFVEDIYDAIKMIELFTNKVLKKEFMSNNEKQSAVIRQIEIIGEAVKNIPEGFRNKYPQIEWKTIAGTRDVIIHAYFGVSYEKVWEFIITDIPKLKKQIKEILKNEKLLGNF